MYPRVRTRTRRAVRRRGGVCLERVQRLRRVTAGAEKIARRASERQLAQLGAKRRNNSKISKKFIPPLTHSLYATKYICFPAILRLNYHISKRATRDWGSKGRECGHAWIDIVDSGEPYLQKSNEIPGACHILEQEVTSEAQDSGWNGSPDGFAEGLRVRAGAKLLHAEGSGGIGQNNTKGDELMVEMISAMKTVQIETGELVVLTLHSLGDCQWVIAGRELNQAILK